jgi:hypothetical protein
MLSLVFGQGFSNEESLVQFQWSSRAHFDRQDFDIPFLNVTFANGVTDTLILSRYDPGDDAFLELEGVNAEDLNHCLFIGHLAHESDSSAAVTGCPHDDEFEVTLFSKNSPEQGLFSVTQGGSRVKALKNPLEEEGCKFETLKSDYHVDMADLAKQVDRQSIPSTMTMNILLGFGRNFNIRRGGTTNSANYLRAVINQAQASFFHSSLGTRITLRVVRIVYFSRNIFQASSTQASAIANSGGVTRDTNVHVSSLWGAHQGPGVIGIAPIAAICGNPNRRFHINEDTNSISRNGILFSHETGHNMGMFHDEDSRLRCSPTGIMGSRLGFSRIWTSCSRTWFFNYVRAVIRSTGSFCMASCVDRWSLCGRYTAFCSRSSTFRNFWCRRTCRVC